MSPTTATPAAGYEFVKWSIESGEITLSPNAQTNPATFTMPAGSVSVKAEFKKEEPSLSAPDGSLLSGMTGGGTPPTGTTSYIGAFWKHDQIGERVIKINMGTTTTNLGTWNAEVAWYDSQWDPANGDGVVLASGGSSDANIYKETPGDAEDYKVSGTTAKVSGTVASGADIVFRIGLTKKFTSYNKDSNPARYAVVVLTYGGASAKKQKLFLRQGEGADYVMRPADKNGSGGEVGGASENRFYAKKFSPYNLTDPAGNTATDYNAMISAATGLLDVNGGTFVDYPTMAGYFFQYNNSKRAFHPTSPTGAFTNWSTNYYGIEFWKAEDDETCPEGYRRPQDGNNTAHNTAGAVAGSEMRQSLWLDPHNSNLDNSVWGYYADGYFDRHEIKSSASNYSATAVSPATKDAGYLGRLFFNPTASSDSYNASLFFPAAGGRYSNYDGTLNYAGYNGIYSSSSSRSSGFAWYLNFTSGLAHQTNSLRSYGLAVRCVLQ